MINLPTGIGGAGATDDNGAEEVISELVGEPIGGVVGELAGRPFGEIVGRLVGGPVGEDNGGPVDTNVGI